MRIVVIISLLLFEVTLFGQFTPGAGLPGSEAVHKDDSEVSFWANEVVSAQRGWLDIADTTLGKVDFGVSSDMFEADGQFYSLGDAGEVILTFPYTIYNEAGPDFAVFENGFDATPPEENHYFLELGIVSVSFDGINYTSFPAESFTDTSGDFTGFGFIDASEINNLAGKYVLNFGTPFDLEELGIDSIRYVKVVDVIGGKESAASTLDVNDYPIIDPYPTPFASGGFDMDGVAALNQKIDLVSIQDLNKGGIFLAQNPIRSGQEILVYADLPEMFSLKVSALDGKEVYKNSFQQTIQIPTSNWIPGIYIVQVYNQLNNYFAKVVVQ